MYYPIYLFLFRVRGWSLLVDSPNLSIDGPFFWIIKWLSTHKMSPPVWMPLSLLTSRILCTSFHFCQCTYNSFGQDPSPHPALNRNGRIPTICLHWGLPLTQTNPGFTTHVPSLRSRVLWKHQIPSSALNSKQKSITIICLLSNSEVLELMLIFISKWKNSEMCVFYFAFTHFYESSFA